MPAIGQKLSCCFYLFQNGTFFYTRLVYMFAKVYVIFAVEQKIILFQRLSTAERVALSAIDTSLVHEARLNFGNVRHFCVNTRKD